MNTKRDEEGMVTCDVCGKKFSSEEEHNMHHHAAHGAIMGNEVETPKSAKSAHDKPLM